jgi:predicted TIM-barrel fold metal-dependent hydrolase
MKLFESPGISRIVILLAVPVLSVLNGCSTGYYDTADFNKVAKIDAHVHLNSENSFFEEQAGKDNFRLITLNVDHSDRAAVEEQLRHSLSAVGKYHGKVFYAATFYFDTTGWNDGGWSDKAIEQLSGNISGGAVSVKFWKNIGMTIRDRNSKFIMVDDPGMDPVIDFIVSKNLPVTGHLGEPRNCWLPLDKMTVRGDSSYFAHNPQYHMYLHPDYPSYEAQITARDNMLVKHPSLKFIGCHLGSLEWSVDELAAHLDRFPNAAVDLAARICHLQYQAKSNHEKVRDFCIKYQDRLIYGTDLADEGRGDPRQLCENIHKTWIDDWRFFATGEVMKGDAFSGTFKGLHLPGEVVDKIFAANAIKWYNLPPE